MTARRARRRRAPGRPEDPKALRRTGVRLSVLIRREDLERYHARARARGLRLSEHVLDLLDREASNH